jgi:antitoxin MazE
MKAKIVRIGNSRGLRIPKPLLEEAGLEGDVEMHVEGHRLVVTPADRPRAGWDEAFEEMSRAGDDVLLDGDVVVPTQWEEDGWEWPSGDLRSTS